MNGEHGKRTYVLVWAALVLLLAATVAAAYVQFGRFNPVVAIGIALTKAGLIVLYFMHLRSTSKLIWVVTAASVVWLAIMFTLTIADYETRAFLPEATVWQQ